MDIRLSQLLRALTAIILLPILHLSEAGAGLAQVKTSINTEVLTRKRLSQLAEKANQLIQERDYSKAADAWKKAINYAESELGDEHPEVAQGLNRLAILYADQGLAKKAEPLYLRALAILEKAFGADHTNTSLILGNLANLYLGQGLYNKADDLYLRAL